MEVYRGISTIELQAILCSGFIFSTDSQWKQDSTWHLSQKRTFFSQNKETADQFAIGAYISGYGATGRIIQLYLMSGNRRLVSVAYTLEAKVSEALLRSDTEFAERGDDELYTTKPIPIKCIQNMYVHKVLLSGIQDNGLFIITALTKKILLNGIPGLSSSSTRPSPSSMSPYTNYPSQDRRFWLKVTVDGRYVCVATSLDGILISYEITDDIPLKA